MTYSLAFTLFLEKWGSEYAILKRHITKLKEHQGILDKFDIGEIYNAEELDIWVEDWLWLQSKFDHPLDIMFYKPYWVPIQKHSYEFMVDLSAGTFEIFEINYISIEPYAWAQGFKFPTLPILNSSQENYNLITELYLLKKKESEFDFLHDFVENRDSAAYRGYLEVEPVTFEEVFNTNLEVTEEDISIIPKAINVEGNNIIINNVNVLAIGLLPFETPIIHEIDIHNFGGERHNDKIMNVRDMVYYLRSNGFMGIEVLKANIPLTSTKFIYNKTQLEIINLDLRLLEIFKNSYNQL